MLLGVYICVHKCTSPQVYVSVYLLWWCSWDSWASTATALPHPCQTGKGWWSALQRELDLSGLVLQWHNFHPMLRWNDSFSRKMWILTLNKLEIRLPRSSSEYLCLLWICLHLIRWQRSLWYSLNHHCPSAEMCLERTAGAEHYCSGLHNG